MLLSGLSPPTLANIVSSQTPGTPAPSAAFTTPASLAIPASPGTPATPAYF